MQPLWTPSQKAIDALQLTEFTSFLEKETGKKFPDYAALHGYSVSNPAFWQSFARYAQIKNVADADEVLRGSDMLTAKWFPATTLNYAQDILERPFEGTALIFQGETRVKTRMSYDELRRKTAQMAAFLKSQGVSCGDRVAGVLPNHPAAIIAMLASASLGAVWSSCSPDFGEQGILDRFGQIEPIVLLGVNGYYYNGKTIDTREKLARVKAALPSVKAAVMVEYAEGLEIDTNVFEPFESACTGQGQCTLTFTPVPFDHPLYILFSSGTTGAPKCIIHGHGGTLLQHRKEHLLHSDIRHGDSVFYFCTCSWMMWNWLVSALGCGATLMLFDGSPFVAGPQTLWDYAQEAQCSFFGTSAKYIDALRKAEFDAASHDLGALRTVASTGSPLSLDGFDYIYQRIKSDVHLASISGGTDIVSCFVLGVPSLPVYPGEIQAPGLGMASDVWQEGASAPTGAQGELVCTVPFPSQPVGFWGDMDQAKYRAAYFDTFDGVWTHGDFAEKTEHGGFIIHGRSDATLNPGGVRIGTAEIYREVERFEEINEAIVIGQTWDNDVRVVLFVVLREGEDLSDDLVARIKTAIKTGCTPRHVPAKILAVGDIPRTKSGKITELAVRDVVNGRSVKNTHALANPEALELYKNRPELAT